MTDRIHSLTIVLEKNTRSDDVQPLIDAIKMMRGVLSVKANVANLDTYTAEIRARSEVIEDLCNIIAKMEAK